VHGGDELNDNETAMANLDLRALYIRVMTIRSRVLKYVKHLPGDVPCQASQDASANAPSQFQHLGQELAALGSSMPDMTPENTNLYRSSGRLSL
jgi:hypothetical protein